MRTSQSNAFYYAAIVTLGGFVFGLDLGVIAGGLSQISEQFGLSDIQLGAIGAAPGFGAIFALFFAGPISNRLGRKATIQLIALLYLVSAVTSALAPDYRMLWSARFLGGLAFCSLALASMYIGEIAPSDKRGRLVAMNQINIALGLLAAFFINFLIQQIADSGSELAVSLNLQTTAWRWMLGSEIIPALVWLLLLFGVPKSPRWLMSVGREDEARTAMSKVLPGESVEPEMQSIRQSMSQREAGATSFSQLFQLFGRHARKATILGIVIAAVQPITGINAILTYAPIVFEQAGSADPLWNTIWIGVVGLLANFLAFALVDRLGRRPIVVFGLFWCVLSLSACGWAFHQARYSLDEAAVAAVQLELGEEHASAVANLTNEIDVEYANDIEFMKGMKAALGEELANSQKNFLIGKAAQLNTNLVLAAILSFIAAFNVSIGPIMWVVFSEIFPTTLRGIAIPAAQLVTATVNYFVQQFFPWQLANMGARDIFLFYGICVTVGLVLLFFLLPETKNKSIEQIESELNG